MATKKPSVKDIVYALAKERGLDINKIPKAGSDISSGGGVKERLESGAGFVESFTGAGAQRVKQIRKSLTPSNIAKSFYKEFFSGDDIFSAYARGRLAKYERKKELEKQAKIKPADEVMKSSQEASQESVSPEFLKDVSNSLQIVAENTMSIQTMARDVNVFRQNMQELVKIWGNTEKQKTPASKADIHYRTEAENRKKYQSKVERVRAEDLEYFAEQDRLESELEASRGKSPAGKGQAKADTQKAKEGAGGGGGLMDLLGMGGRFLGNIVKFVARGIMSAIRFLFNPKMILRFLGRAFFLTAIIGTLVSGIIDGFKKFQETGSFTEAIITAVGGMLEFLTFGLFGDKELRNIIDTVSAFFKPAIDLITSLFKKVKDFFINLFGGNESGAGTDTRESVADGMPRVGPNGEPIEKNESGQYGYYTDIDGVRTFVPVPTKRGDAAGRLVKRADGGYDMLPSEFPQPAPVPPGEEVAPSTSTPAATTPAGSLPTPPAGIPKTGPNGEAIVQNPRTKEWGYYQRQGRGRNFVPVAATSPSQVPADGAPGAPGLSGVGGAGGAGGAGATGPTGPKGEPAAYDPKTGKYGYYERTGRTLKFVPFDTGTSTPSGTSEVPSNAVTSNLKLVKRADGEYDVIPDKGSSKAKTGPKGEPLVYDASYGKYGYYTGSNRARRFVPVDDDGTPTKVDRSPQQIKSDAAEVQKSEKELETLYGDWINERNSIASDLSKQGIVFSGDPNSSDYPDQLKNIDKKYSILIENKKNDIDRLKKKPGVIDFLQKQKNNLYINFDSLDREARGPIKISGSNYLSGDKVDVSNLNISPKTTDLSTGPVTNLSSLSRPITSSDSGQQTGTEGMSTPGVTSTPGATPGVTSTPGATPAVTSTPGAPGVTSTENLTPSGGMTGSTNILGAKSPSISKPSSGKSGGSPYSSMASLLSPNDGEMTPQESSSSLSGPSSEELRQSSSPTSDTNVRTKNIPGSLLSQQSRYVDEGKRMEGIPEEPIIISSPAPTIVGGTNNAQETRQKVASAYDIDLLKKLATT